MNTGDAGLWSSPQTTRWLLVRVANYQGRGAVGGIALITRRTVEEREKGWNGPRLAGAWLHYSVCAASSAHAGRRSAFSKAIIACLWRLETCEAETRKGSTAEQTPPQTCTCLLTVPINDHSERMRLPAHGTRRSRKCDIDWPCRCVSRHPKMSSRCKGV